MFPAEDYLRFSFLSLAADGSYGYIIHTNAQHEHNKLNYFKNYNVQLLSKRAEDIKRARGGSSSLFIL